MTKPSPYSVGKLRVLTRKDRVFLLLLCALWLVSLSPFLNYWFSPINRSSYFWLFVWSVILIGLHFLLQAFRLFIFFKARKPVEVPLSTESLKVAVVTTYVEGEAPIEFVRETLESLRDIEYPHDTFLLDETDSPQLKTLCREIGVLHFSRKGISHLNTREGRFAARTRHGNYNSWLKSIGFESYDVLTAFDLDHRPKKNFLRKTIGYFEDPQIGYVQAPQVYFNQKDSWIARAAAEKTFRYYSIGQMARFGGDATILDGCHNVNRISALSQIGGFQPHKADDLLTTLKYLTHGWKGVYVPGILAEGRAPMDWKAYFIQQYQWAYTTLDIKFRTLPKIYRSLTGSQKLMALMHGNSYFSGATWALTLLTLVAMLSFNWNLPLLDLQMLRYLLPILSVRFVFFVWQQQFYIDRKNEKGLHWKNFIVSYAVLPYYFLAFARVITGRKHSFLVTPKTPSKIIQFKVFWPHLSIAALLAGVVFYRSLNSGENMHLLYLCAFLTFVLNIIPVAYEFFRKISYSAVPFSPMKSTHIRG